MNHYTKSNNKILTYEDLIRAAEKHKPPVVAVGVSYIEENIIQVIDFEEMSKYSPMFGEPGKMILFNKNNDYIRDLLIKSGCKIKEV